ncbi:hypothetical protein BC941DRAFT_348402 [Chlamydoabsidia padenii]|nr:hypothetical protein BC941DRAFT_348402 [Chlamydoabsidia padenii]
MTYVKYTEGYLEIGNKTIVSKPYQYWSSSNQQLALVNRNQWGKVTQESFWLIFFFFFPKASNYVEAVTFSLQLCLYFMLQCFWNYLSNVVAKRDFMSSLEFKFYLVWSIATIAMFPVLQWYYHYDPVKEEVIPQIAYSAQIFIIAGLGLRNYFRFGGIIHNGVKSNANSLVINKLKYFKDINSLMTVCLFSYSISFLIMCVDGMTEAKTIASNKFATDCLFANINICNLFLYILFIATFHPRKHYAVSKAVSSINAKIDDNPPMKKMTSTADSVKPTSSLSKRFNSEAMIMHDIKDVHRSKTFIRPMIPISVDYPPSDVADTMPLTTPSPPPSTQWYPQPHAESTDRPPSPSEQSDWLRRSPNRRIH